MSNVAYLLTLLMQAQQPDPAALEALTFSHATFQCPEGFSGEVTGIAPSPTGLRPTTDSEIGQTRSFSVRCVRKVRAGMPACRNGRPVIPTRGFDRCTVDAPAPVAGRPRTSGVVDGSSNTVAIGEAPATASAPSSATSPGVPGPQARAVIESIDPATQPMCAEGRIRAADIDGLTDVCVLVGIRAPTVRIASPGVRQVQGQQAPSQE